MFDSVTPARMSKEMANLTTLWIENKKCKKNSLLTSSAYSLPAIWNRLAQKNKSLVKRTLMQRTFSSQFRQLEYYRKLGVKG